MSKRTAGAALIGVALLLVVAAWGFRAWQNSDTQQTKRETAALTEALSTRSHYLPPDDPSPAGSLLLLGGAAVLFLSGIILVAVSPPPAEHGASDRPEPEKASP